MASPLGHSLLGLTIGRINSPVDGVRQWHWYLFCVGAANAADLDFFPGVFIGDINRFHHGVTHSLFAAVAFGVTVTFCMRRFSTRLVRVGIVSISLYASHLLLDFFTKDTRVPFGMPLLWPFSSEHFTSPWPIFKGVHHGVPGDAFSAFLWNLLSWENVGVLGVEMLVLLPILLLFWCRYRYRGEESKLPGLPVTLIRR